MTKSVYTNARQKEALVMFLACAQFLEQGIETGIQGAPKECLGDLKRARTYSWKGAVAWLKTLDEKAQRSILNMIKDTNIAIVARKQARDSEIATKLLIGVEEIADLMDKEIQRLERDRVKEHETIMSSKSTSEQREAAVRRYSFRLRLMSEYKKARDMVHDILEKSSRI